MAILQDWTSQEIHYSAFDDFRHGRRLEEVVGCLSKHPSQSIPQASENKSESQSIYRLWANKRVKPEQMRASHRMSVIDRVNQHSIVLAIQDTSQVKLIHMGDREADIFDLFVMPRQANNELLIRAEHNRKIQHELDYLIPSIEQAAVMGQMKIEIPRNPERSARTACLALRAMAVTIEVPRHQKHRSTYQPIQLNIILVEEVNSSPGVQPIRWLLLTTLPIETLAQVWQCVRWYSLRWLIERFHYTLKSGCKTLATATRNLR
jgi:Transposase DNA-binding